MPANMLCLIQGFKTFCVGACSCANFSGDACSSTSLWYGMWKKGILAGSNFVITFWGLRFEGMFEFQNLIHIWEQKKEKNFLILAKSFQSTNNACVRACLRVTEREMREADRNSMSVPSALIEISWTLAAALSLSKTRWHHHYWTHQSRLRSSSSDLTSPLPPPLPSSPYGNSSSHSPAFERETYVFIPAGSRVALGSDAHHLWPGTRAETQREARNQKGWGVKPSLTRRLRGRQSLRALRAHSFCAGARRAEQTPTFIQLAGCRLL